MIWKASVDMRVNLVAAAQGKRGTFWIRIVDRSFYLFLQGNYLECSRNILVLRRKADKHDEGQWP